MSKKLRFIFKLHIFVYKNINTAKHTTWSGMCVFQCMCVFMVSRFEHLNMYCYNTYRHFKYDLKKSSDFALVGVKIYLFWSSQPVRRAGLNHDLIVFKP